MQKLCENNGAVPRFRTFNCIQNRLSTITRAPAKYDVKDNYGCPDVAGFGYYISGILVFLREVWQPI
jgi:hypothetical protein